MAHDDHDDETPKNLTKNEAMVYEAMKLTDRPQKAYDLLDVLKSSGVRAPMTIYRALEGLEQKGLVHKLDALNAFVRCNHDQPHEVETFLVCDKCSQVQEIETNVGQAVPSVESNVRAVVIEKGFRMSAARLEIKGVCARCAEPALATG
ncbi:Fur family transcriptional regulator [Parvularcula sp. IMCC14364]|uniref:Fur family transcriptional regulator n=1 Tax=Parvularcula sp. IMCC14364 TaxID=3067902 RepID=UPI002741E438|nr:transcriptional repressor [Parvularcula sp. IMCC14364]